MKQLNLKKATQFVTGKGKKGGAIVVRQKTGIDKLPKLWVVNLLHLQ